MFANLESFSIFFFISLAFIVLAIVFEDKLVALEKKYDKKRAAKRQAEKAAARNTAASVRHCPTQRVAAKNNTAPKRTRSNIAA